MDDNRPLSRRALLTIVAVLVLSAGAVIGSVVATARAERPWDPLGSFPEQAVIGIAADSVTVVGTKCYDEPVDIVGSWWWQTVEPPGSAVAPLSGSTTRAAGCHESTFVNLVPPEVRSIDTQLGGATWIVTGVETPIDEQSGREGVPHTWRTEPFELPPSED
ncbi:MAG: hypothetical protein AAF567_24600 [Actinomycetota bacterium]